MLRQLIMIVLVMFICNHTLGCKKKSSDTVLQTKSKIDLFNPSKNLIGKWLISEDGSKYIEFHQDETGSMNGEDFFVWTATKERVLITHVDKTSFYILDYKINGSKMRVTAGNSGGTELIKEKSSNEGKSIPLSKEEIANEKKKITPQISDQIGKTGPAGGIIFYDKGHITDGWQFLEVAPANTVFESSWNNATKKCNELTINGFSDWYLPSLDELRILGLNLLIRKLGDFPENGDHYWSSDEYSDIIGFLFDISYYCIGSSVTDKYRPHKVRAIRAY